MDAAGDSELGAREAVGERGALEQSLAGVAGLERPPPFGSGEVLAAREDEDSLFIAPRQAPAPAPQKAGWLSLFGGRRYEQQPAQEPEPAPQARGKQPVVEARTTASAQPVEAAEQDDLEIPSFLRRLAN